MAPEGLIPLLSIQLKQSLYDAGLIALCPRCLREDGLCAACLEREGPKLAKGHLWKIMAKPGYVRVSETAEERAAREAYESKAVRRAEALARMTAAIGGTRTRNQKRKVA